MAGSFRIDFDLAAVNREFDQLETDIKAQARPAAQAAAQVLYDEVRRRVPVADEAHIGRGGKVYQPGALRDAIYQAYSDKLSVGGREVYHVSWNARKAGHGHLIEFGYFRKFKVFKTKDGRYITTKIPLAAPVQMPAQPFLRPAYDAKRDEASRAAKDRFLTGLDQKMKK